MDFFVSFRKNLAHEIYYDIHVVFEYNTCDGAIQSQIV